MYTSQIQPELQTPLSLSTPILQTSQIIPVQPAMMQTLVQIPQPQQSLIQIPQQVIQVPQPQPINYLMPTTTTQVIPQVQMPPREITVPAIPYSRFIPPTPTIETNQNSTRIIQYYKYVPVDQIVPAAPQYQTLSAPVMLTNSVPVL